MLPARNKVGATARLFLNDDWTLNCNYRWSDVTPAEPKPTSSTRRANDTASAVDMPGEISASSVCSIGEASVDGVLGLVGQTRPRRDRLTGRLRGPVQRVLVDAGDEVRQHDGRRLVDGGGHGWRSGYNLSAVPHSLRFLASAFASKRATSALKGLTLPGGGKR